MVQDGVYDRFVNAFGAAVKAQLHCGNGLDPNTTQGPLINSRGMSKVILSVATGHCRAITVIVYLSCSSSFPFSTSRSVALLSPPVSLLMLVCMGVVVCLPVSVFSPSLSVPLLYFSRSSSVCLSVSLSPSALSFSL